MEQNTPASQLPDEALVGSLLMRTSRTFALNIPLLPANLRKQVGIAYLLFRIADTVEDGVLVDRNTKRRLFRQFVAALEADSSDLRAAELFCESAAETNPHDDPACMELIGELPRLLAMLAVDTEASITIRRRVIESAIGMQRFTMAGGPCGSVRLKSLLELRQYCYFVAGIVGELLTELFILNEPQLVAVKAELMQFAPLFGEGLQLVNILKDAGDDASEGRQFVHPAVPRGHLFDFARSDLWYANEYIRVLQQANASAGVVQFTRLPVQLATATLDCVEEHGPGSKISRDAVAQIIASVLQSTAGDHVTAAPTAKKILLAAPRGFCAGVDMAIEALDIAIDRLGTPIYVYHEIVHNRHIVENFTARGAVFVNSMADVPHGSNLIFSAHGVSPEVRTAAAKRDLFTIDATCPLVAKVHIEVTRFSRLGYHIILIGHAGHDEVVGTVGEAPHAITLVQSEDEIAALSFAADEKLAWLTQTTLSVSDTADLVALLEKKFPQIVGPPKDDICYATQNRQAAIQTLCEEADAVIVVGSQNSSNSQRLKELAIQHNVPAWLVDGVSGLRRDDFVDCRTIAVTAGASAPESAVEDVLSWLGSKFTTELEVRTHTREDRVFSLPVELETKAAKRRSS